MTMNDVLKLEMFYLLVFENDNVVKTIPIHKD